MTKRGIIIAFSGALGLYTGALSIVVAELLRWKRVRFSDFIRQAAISRGDDPDDRGVLQRLGQELVRELPEYFVRSVLEMAEWSPGESLILDGLRHAEVFRELRRQIEPSTDLYVAHITIGDRARRADRAKRAEGLTDDQFALYDRDVTEAQVEETPAYANLSLDGGEPRGELARTIVRRFVPNSTPQHAVDEGDSISSMEPLVLGSPLIPLASELMREASAFANEIPIGLAQSLAELVREMNCYYSNLIEGHRAPPVEIGLALNGDYERDPQKRHLQAEAQAHISVQRWLDGDGLSGQPAAAAQSLMEIHDRFFSEFPEAQWVEDPVSKRRAYVIPGHYRQHYTRVGLHEPPSPGSIGRFMARFEEVYTRIDKPEQAILAVATAHHRLLWIHPFGDGNGRVARLMSDAMLSDILNTRSIWSVSRGLALATDRYKQLLAACDLRRRNDFDGRGNLSEETLGEFTAFFLNTCLKEVRFMRQRMRLSELRTHIDQWVEASAAFEERGVGEGKHLPRLHPDAGRILKAALDVGALSVSEARQLLSAGNDADEVIRQLTATGVLRQRGDGLTFSLPAKFAERFFPGLFP